MRSTGWIRRGFEFHRLVPLNSVTPGGIVHVMTRRKFLGTTIAGGATVLAGTVFQKLALAVTSSATPTTFQMGGDLSVNRLGFGAMRLTGQGIWGWPPDRENAKKVLRRAVDLGVNLIDTADAYGPETDELLIAEALHPYPKGLVIATKGGITRPGPGQWVPNGRPEYLSQCVDKSLKRLKLERIDLYQLHTVDRKVPIEESVGALKAAQDAGKIRHVGLSNVTTQEIERAKRFCPLSAFRTDTTSPTASRRMCSVIARKKRWDSCHGLQLAAVEEVR